VLRGFFCNMKVIDISTTKLKEKINKTIKPRLKKVGGEVKEVEVGKVTRDDVLNLIKIKKAKNKIENWLEEHSLSGDTNPAVSIFNLKNNFKWTDKTETDITSKGDKIENNNIVNIELSDRVRHLEAK